MEKRYVVGSIGLHGEFERDTIGNDPELTTFDTLAAAIADALEYIKHYESTTREAAPDVTILDSEMGMIIWRAAAKTGRSA